MKNNPKLTNWAVKEFLICVKVRGPEYLSEKKKKNPLPQGTDLFIKKLSGNYFSRSGFCNKFLRMSNF